jgi:predicted RNA polymerase sigma factor
MPLQEALLAAATQWPEQGVPESPRAWLVTVASRRLVAGGARERPPSSRGTGHGPRRADLGPVAERDDTLTLLFLCCHPSLSVPSQLALTLRAVGGLTTAEIANAFLVPEPTMAQRISRAKQTIRNAGARFDLPPEAEREDRLRVVLHVLYLLFNEGYTTSAGPALHRADLTSEAIRLARLLRRLVPEHGEIAGLLALMLLTDARRAARTTPDGALVPLAEQDRALWDRTQIEEGVGIIGDTLGGLRSGRTSCRRRSPRSTTRPERRRDRLAADPRPVRRARTGLARPVVTLNRAVAVAMVDGPRAGLAVLGTLDADDRMTHTPPSRGRPGASARARGRARRGARVLPARRRG